MPSAPEPDNHHARSLSAIAIGVVWLAGLAGFIAMPHLDVVRGLLFVLLGTSSLGLAVHGSRAARAARTTAGFWQAAARHAWLAGGLGSVLLFVRALTAPSSAIGDVASRMAMAFAAAAWGLALAMLFGLIGTRVERRATAAGRGRQASMAERILGVVLLVGLIGFTTVGLPLGSGVGGLQPWALLVHWPAILLVVGAAFSGIAAAGDGMRAETAAPACALAGTLGGLVGLVLAMTGFAQPDLGRVTAGVSFMITSCSTGLLGLLAAASLREGEDAGGRGTSASVVRASWVLFPLVSLLFLVVVFLLVVTPMTKR
jgi:hypothetical protein